MTLDVTYSMTGFTRSTYLVFEVYIILLHIIPYLRSNNSNCKGPGTRRYRRAPTLSELFGPK